MRPGRSVLGPRGKRLARPALLLVLALVSAEVAVRLLVGPLTGRAYDGAARAARQRARLDLVEARLSAAEGAVGIYRLHPYLAYVGRQGVRPWRDSETAFNAFGMLSTQGYDYPYHRQGDEFVVAVVGGSVAEGYANFAQADLQRALAARSAALGGRKLVLINLATGGYKEPQQLIMLEYALLSGFDLDAVLNLDGFNDIVLAAENASAGLDILWPSGGHYETAVGAERGIFSSAVVRRLAAVYTEYARQRSILTASLSTPLVHSALAGVTADALVAWRERRIEQLNGEIVALSQEPSSATESAPPAGPSATSASGSPGAATAANGSSGAATSAEVYDRAASVWADASRMMYAICRQRKVVYVHALQPNQYVVGSKPLTEHERRTAYSPEGTWAQYARSGYPVLLATGAALKAEGVPFYDMTRVFENVTEDLYTDDCCHFSQRGFAILSESIAEALVAETERAAARP